MFAESLLKRFTKFRKFSIDYGTIVALLLGSIKPLNHHHIVTSLDTMMNVNMSTQDLYAQGVLSSPILTAVTNFSVVNSIVSKCIARSAHVLFRADFKAWMAILSVSLASRWRFHWEEVVAGMRHHKTAQITARRINSGMSWVWDGQCVFEDVPDRKPVLKVYTACVWFAHMRNVSIQVIPTILHVWHLHH